MIYMDPEFPGFESIEKGEKIMFSTLISGHGGFI